MPSDAARAEMFAQQTGEVYLDLLEVSNPQLASPLYFVNNTQAIVSNGKTYEPAIFTFNLPNTKVGGSTKASFTISNIDRRAVELARSVSTPLQLTGMTIRASLPDVYEAGPIIFSLREVKWTEQSLTGTLYDDIDGGMAVPKLTFNPADFPGLY